jgi:hypothetical protein
MHARVVAAAGLLWLLAAGPAAAPAAGPAAPRPSVVSLAAQPRVVPAEGGAVRLVVRVRDATRCTFRHQPAPFAALRVDAVVGCASGRASKVVRIAANPYRHALTIRADVQVAGRTGRAAKAVSIVQAAAPAPLAVAVVPVAAGVVGTPYSARLDASGGRPPYTWTLAGGSLPGGLALASDGTIAGTPAGSGRSSFTVKVADAAGRTATAPFALSVSAPLLPVAALTTSSNWSGYALDGSGFTAVTGTFAVPTVSGGTSTSSTVQWVGIDGNSDANQYLIQAGVAEDGDTGSGGDVYAWWEILPAPETRIDSLPVSPGDTVTVAIRQAAPGSWTIQLVDVTRSRSFATTQSYGGQALSAEWVVEAASTTSGTILTLGPYSPNVVFTGIGWTGHATGFTPIQLEQDQGVVSVPSALGADQTAFAVAYGSSAPAAPG